MRVVAGAQSRQVRLDEAGADRREVGDAGIGQGGEIAVQIPTVRGERVRGEATFDGQVVEVTANGTAQRRRGWCAHAGGVRAAGQPATVQARASASGSTSMPCASATGP
ncbi:hypothetical protein PSN01_03681 [Micromonospora saelicesensis]|nr:hypothetical protein PSN01_03681 [Micromonospora saelicesensis]